MKFQDESSVAYLSAKDKEAAHGKHGGERCPKKIHSVFPENSRNHRDLAGKRQIFYKKYVHRLDIFEIMV
ncbi:MAG: hypothetical protein V8R27_00020 [Oscillospiraceae bacterium]